MSKPVEAMIGYLKHAVKAQSKYKIHSPFVYGFYQKVLMDHQVSIQYRIVNRLRNELMTTGRFIKRKDLGAGCKDFPGDQRFVRVKDIIHHSSVTSRNGEMLFRLVREYQPSTILELGTSLGISAIYFGLANPESRIVSIEGCIDSANLARENIEKSGLKNIEVITGNFEEKLDVAFGMIPSPDLIFFDGNHRKEPTLAYFEKCLQHSHPESIFIFDDIHWSSGMEAAWNIIRKHPAVKVSIDIYHMGIVFFREELSKEDFIIRY